MTTLLPKLYPLILLLLGLLVFLPFLGYSPLFDGAELRFAEAAREMLVTNTFSYSQLDFQPDYATPPLLPWLQALAMRIFGVADEAEVAARLPSALMGIVTLLTLFYIGRKKHDARFGFLWALSYLGTITPLVLAKSALPDSTGSFFMFLGICFLYELTSSPKAAGYVKNVGLAGLFFGAALLTTGSSAWSLFVLGLLLSFYWRTAEQPTGAKILTCLLVLIIPVLCLAAWMLALPMHDWQHVLFPIDRTRNPFEGLYFLAGGIISIWVPITLSSRYWSARKIKAISVISFDTWMITLSGWGAQFFVFFLPGGILLTWFLLSYLTTYHLHQILRSERVWDNLNTYLLMAGGLVVGLLMIAVPLLGMNPDWLARRMSDPYWVGITGAPVNWQGWEWGIGVALIMATTVFVLGLRRRVFGSIIGLYLSTAVCTLAFLAVVVPKIEQYLQGPLIDYCESKWNQPVYVQTSFPSYAPLFYTRKKPPVNPNSRRIDWLVNGPVDKQTFIISTATDAGRFRYKNTLVVESEDYGYVLLRRNQYR